MFISKLSSAIADDYNMGLIVLKYLYHSFPCLLNISINPAVTSLHI